MFYLPVCLKSCAAIKSDESENCYIIAQDYTRKSDCVHMFRFIFLIQMLRKFKFGTMCFRYANIIAILQKPKISFAYFIYLLKDELSIV